MRWFPDMYRPLKSCWWVFKKIIVATIHLPQQWHIQPNKQLQEKGSPATAMYLVIHGEIEAWAFEVRAGFVILYRLLRFDWWYDLTPPYFWCLRLHSQGRGVEGVDEPVTLSGGDYLGETALIGLVHRGPPPRSPINAASLSFCDVFTLTRVAAIGLLDTLGDAERSEWLEITCKHAEGLVRDIEDGDAPREREKLASPRPDILASKMEELKRKEMELSSLREEVVALISSRVSELS